jgi:hypothetical protein
MRAEGKEYVVKDGDVLNFLFNVWLASVVKKSPLTKGLFYLRWQYIDQEKTKLL